MLRRRRRILTEVLHNHNTTMIALTHSAPMQALGRSVQAMQERVQGVGQKRGLEDAADLSETAPPAKSPKAAIFRKQIDGNPDNRGMHPWRLRRRLRVLFLSREQVLEC